MPPANSPNDTPPAVSDETSPYLQSLAAISSPVPNFAATLMTPDEQEVNEANTSFLRTRIPDPTDDESSATDFVDYRTLLDWYNRARDRQEGFRTQRAQERERLAPRPSNNRVAGYWQSRSRPSWVQERRREMSRQAGGSAEGDTNYANRTPQRQSLYDWAPYTPIIDDMDGAAESQNADAEDDDLPSYASYARYRWLERRQNYDQPRSERNPGRRQPRDEPSGRATRSSISESLRNELATHPRFGNTWNDRGLQREWERTRRDQLSSAQALLRSVDRLRRAQSRARSNISNPAWQRYVTLAGDSEDLRNETRNTLARLHRSEYEDGVGRHELPIPTQSALQKKFLEDPTLMRLREVMRYLSKLRYCTDPSEKQALVFSHFLSDSKARDSCDSVIQELSSIRPAGSSWLIPGSTFGGIQSASLSPEEAAIFIHHPEQGDQSDGSRRRFSQDQSDSDDIFVTTSSGRTYTADPVPDGPASRHYEFDSLANDPDEPNSWPVSVTIDTLDVQTMNLTGTMSASKIRDNRSPTGESSSTTYFEGEIIDFKNHSLETENFESEGLETDVLYWTRIGPFRDMDETEISQRLLQRKWIEEDLMQNWILMRWKERSFVPPTPCPNPGGISIRGFYYIALHRQSGRIDGSYGNHPESQPYQSLSMKPSSNTISGADHHNTDNVHRIRNQPSKSSITPIFKPSTASTTSTDHHEYIDNGNHIRNGHEDMDDNDDAEEEERRWARDQHIVTSNGVYSSASVESIMRTGRDWTTSSFERAISPELVSESRRESTVSLPITNTATDLLSSLSDETAAIAATTMTSKAEYPENPSTIPESEKINRKDIAVRKWWPAYQIR